MALSLERNTHQEEKMPDIELHGVRLSDFRGRIQDAFEDAPYASEIVLIAPAPPETVIDLSGKPQGFLRIVGSPGYLDEHEEDIRRRLKPLGLDVEFVNLRIFIPKDKL